MTGKYYATGYRRREVGPPNEDWLLTFLFVMVVLILSNLP
jgi:hypothetical protein